MSLNLLLILTLGRGKVKITCNDIVYQGPVQLGTSMVFGVQGMTVTLTLTLNLYPNPNPNTNPNPTNVTLTLIITLNIIRTP